MLIKGMKKDMTCTTKGNTQKYEQGGIVEVSGAPECCKNGIHYVEAPHDVFNHYAAGESRFFEVEPLGEVARKEGKDSKCATNKIRIGGEINAQAICKIAVKGFFEWFKFNNKIQSAETKNAEDCGAANAVILLPGGKGA